MYLLTLALLVYGVVNTSPYQAFMETLPHGVYVEPETYQVVASLLSVPVQGTPEQLGTYEVLSPEKAARYYKDGVAIRNVTPQEVRYGYSATKDLNQVPMGEFINSLNGCIAYCREFLEDPKNASEIGTVKCWGLFPTIQFNQFIISRAQKNTSTNTNPNTYRKNTYRNLMKNKIVLNAQESDKKLQILDHRTRKDYQKKSDRLFYQALPLAIQDVLVMSLTNAGPKEQIFRIYGGYDEFLKACPNWYWDIKRNIPAQLPSLSLRDTILRLGTPNHDSLNTLLEGWPTLLEDLPYISPDIQTSTTNHGDNGDLLATLLATYNEIGLVYLNSYTYHHRQEYQFR